MHGGITKAATHGVIAAFAGLLLSTASAQAADLGGNCCADLEERVAELEATTARKGNRRMSLTVSGQVTRGILYWNTSVPGASGDTSGVYAGLESHVQSTRFTFSGNAKIRPDLTAGFEFMIETPGGARTSTVSQDTVDGGVSTDGTLAVRTANWYLEDKRLGRVTVGRVNLGGPVGTIDLGGISTVAPSGAWLVGNNFVLSPGRTMGQYQGFFTGGDRIEGIRYDSANIHGFVGQATWGEDDVWSASLRYAGEHAGFRLAAGIGVTVQDPINAAGGLDAITVVRGEQELAGSIALMHVASGLFAQGYYLETTYEAGIGNAIRDVDATNWLVQAGISKNWFGLGNTSLYGEYGRSEGHSAAMFVATTDSDMKIYGIGIVQQIDAAAMEMYLGWRRFEADSVGAGGSGDMDLVHGGARIRF